MKEKKKNEEFHSRREFFKKALKGILPFLGAVMILLFCLLVTILTMTNRMVVAVLPVAVLQVALLV